MTTAPDHLHHLADTLFDAFERNDPDAISACCEADAVICKNGRRSGLLQDLLPSFATLRDRIGQHRYTDVRRELFANGFVEEHRVETVLPTGEPFTIDVCVIGRVGPSGRIVELSEYVDTAASAEGSGAS